MTSGFDISGDEHVDDEHDDKGVFSPVSTDTEEMVENIVSTFPYIFSLFSIIHLA